MKPPTPAAVEHALAILIQSINDENGKNFASRPSEQRLDQPLAQLEENDLALEVARKSISVGAKTWAASLRKRINTLSPIGRVPVELMVEILLDSLRVKDRSCMKRLQQLASVNTRWWNLILSFPRFWTTINSYDNVALKLRRSGGMPLTIALHWDYPLTTPEYDPITMLMGHLGRCRNLQLSSEVEYIKDQLRAAEMPLLEKLDCNGNDPYAPMQFTLPPINKVHSIRLKSALMNWSALTGLKYLHISFGQLSYSTPTAAELARILRSSPLMEVLELEYLYGRVGDGGEKGAEQIELPRLTRLIMRYARLRYNAPILDIIRAKSLRHLQLVETLEVDRGIGTEQYQSLIRTAIQNTAINRVVVLVNNTDVEMRGAGLEDGQVKLLFCYEDQYLPIIYGLAASLPKSVCVDLRISISLIYPGPTQWDIIDAILNHLHGIESLSLTMHPEMINRVVEKLSKPHDAADQTTPDALWPAQELSRLRVTTSPKIGLDFTVIEAGLAALVESRARATGIKLPELKIFNEAGFVLTMVDGRVEWTRQSSS